MATKIYIDQGHNPQNPNAGAEGNGYREQDLVYDIGVILARILQNYGYETRLSRKDPDVILGTSNASSLAIRVSEANAWGADYFISLHTNASVNPMASGSEAYVYSLNSAAYPLAQSILEQLNLSTGLRNRGVQARPGLYVLRRTQMPAVLVELGFITSPVDSTLMADAPQRFAQGVADGIVDYINRVETSSISASEAIAVWERTEEIPGAEPSTPDNNEPSLTYEDFLRENPRRGYLKIQAFAGKQSYPIEGVKIAITRNFDDGQVLFFEGVTDPDGIIDGIELPAPPRENSLVFLTPDKTAEYDMTALYDGVAPQRSKVQIYEGIKSIQPILIGSEDNR
ncbi:MAG: N-acetylmuramoyl-L-alanine amidase [Clostridia bacterium]|nr:N-acetylmuramoyl-L-alanine amidase [Clostridia bacterium]